MTLTTCGGPGRSVEDHRRGEQLWTKSPNDITSLSLPLGMPSWLPTFNASSAIWRLEELLYDIHSLQELQTVAEKNGGRFGNRLSTYEVTNYSCRCGGLAGRLQPGVAPVPRRAKHLLFSRIVSTPPRKNKSLCENQKRAYIAPVPRPLRRAFRDRYNSWRGMRWTRLSPSSGRWMRVRSSRVVLAPRRWCQPPGQARGDGG